MDEIENTEMDEAEGQEPRVRILSIDRIGKKLAEAVDEGSKGLNKIMAVNQNTVITEIVQDNWDTLGPRLTTKLISIKGVSIEDPEFENVYQKMCVDGSQDIVAENLGMIKQYIVDHLKPNTDGFQDQVNMLKRIIEELLMECVQISNLVALKQVVAWLIEDLKLMPELSAVNEIWFDEYKKFDPNQTIIRNSLAMIEACKDQNPEMVLELFRAKFDIDETNVELLKYNGPSWNKCPRTCAMFSPETDEKKEIKMNIQNLEATSDPVYLITDFMNKYESEINVSEENKCFGCKNMEEEQAPKYNAHDPVSEAFFNLYKVSKITSTCDEHGEKYRNIEEKTKKFSVDMLDLCQNKEEVKLLLSVDYTMPKYFPLSQINQMMYPRLHLAVSCYQENVDFVAHPLFQNVLEERCNQSDIKVQKVLSWNNTTNTDKILYILQCFFMLPAYVLAYVPSIFSRKNDIETFLAGKSTENGDKTDGCLSTLKEHFTYPRNRMIAQCQMILVFLIFLTCASMAAQPDRTIQHFSVFWDVGLLIFAIAQTFLHMRNIYIFQNKRSTFDWFPWFGFIANAGIWLAFTLQFVSWWSAGCTQDENSAENCRLSETIEGHVHQVGYYNLGGKIGHLIFGVAVTLSFLSFGYLLQLNMHLGPLITSINACIRDVIAVLPCFLAIQIAFTLGIFYIMLSAEDEKCFGNGDAKYLTGVKNYTKNFDWEEGGTIHHETLILGKERNRFHTWDLAIMTTFWSIFDTGHSEVIGCVPGVPRYLALILWAIYLILHGIVLINLLIALMTTSIDSITNKRVSQWTFTTSKMYLSFIDRTNVLPAPFNLFEILLFIIFGALGLCKKQQRIPAPCQCKRYMNLMIKLCYRYVQKYFPKKTS